MTQSNENDIPRVPPSCFGKDNGTAFPVFMAVVSAIILGVLLASYQFSKNPGTAVTPPGFSTEASSSGKTAVERSVSTEPFSSKAYFGAVAASYDTGISQASVSPLGWGFSEVSYGTGRTFVYRNVAGAKSVSDLLVGEWFVGEARKCLREKYDPAEYEAARLVLDYAVLSLSEDEKASVKKSVENAKACFTDTENENISKALGF